MSFILDALKKSESERQRQAGPALLEMRIARPAHALPPWAMAVGALLLACVAVLAWLAWRPAAPRATGAKPAAALAPLAGGANVQAASGNARTGNAPTGNAPAGNAAAADPASRSVAAGSDAGTTASGGGGDAGAGGGDMAVNPADTAPAIAAPGGSAPAADNRARLQGYAAISGTVPELRLDLHVYAPNPADRYAFINMHKVHEGDVTPEGVQVRQITREGVVLEYQGTEFLLGR